ncbi:MAG: hypothetical protein AAF196_04760 [Planctomycetota bacterium]
MAKRSGFLYEALRARSRGSTTERISRSAVGAGRGLFSWLGDRASDATSAVTGRRRRTTSPGLMLVGVAAGILIVGFALGRWSVGFGGDGRSELSTSSREPGEVLSREKATQPPKGPSALLTYFEDSDFELALDITRTMAAGEYPTTRLVQTAQRGRPVHLLVVGGSKASCERLVRQFRSGQVPNPVPALMSRGKWDHVQGHARVVNAR